MFNTSKNKVSSPSVKAMQICPRIKWKVLDFKAWQLARQIEIYWGLKGRVSLMLDSCLIDKLSTEIYKNQFFRFDFTPICGYMFRFSFLTTLNIYKDYFKGRHSWCWVQLNAKVFHKHIVTGDICPSSSFSWRGYCVCMP